MNENELQWFGSNADKSPIAPFDKGGGPQDRGFWCR
jgi:hypothetical protein